MADLNQGAFYGRLTADAVKETYGEGKVRADFCVCCNSYINGNDYPNFFHLSMFGNHAEKLLPYLKKGQPVTVVYNLKQDRWEKEGKQYSKLSINVEKLQLAGGTKKSDASKPEEMPPEESFEVEETPIGPDEGIF